MTLTKTLSSLLVFLTVLLMVACSETDDPVDEGFIFVYDMALQVDEYKTIDVISNIENIQQVTFEALGPGVIVDDSGVYGVLSGSQTTIKATYLHYETTFNVIIPAENVAVSGPLFDAITIDPIQELDNREDFIMGVDISSIEEVLRRGGKFYDATGRRVSIYHLLKEHGVNYVRIRLWNDPNTPDGTPYGGGNNDLATAISIGNNAKRFGMKILLNYHYSDFWADPGKQVIPKDWAHLTSSDALAQAIYDFTYETMQAMEDGNAKVDMVQIGNEIAPGMITQGTNDYHALNTDNPPRFSLPSSISGSTGNVGNLVKYLNAGLTAAKAQNADVLTMVHIDRGGNNSFSRTFYDRLQSNNVEYDIIGLSYYVFYHGSMANFTNNINDMAIRYNKPVVVAETSYAFTSAPVANASHILTTTYYDYPLTPQGQADVTRDIMEIVAKVPNNHGMGIFYWEPAWLPVPGAGWAGASSPATWANQSLFSYQGVALPSLALFSDVRP